MRLQVPQDEGLGVGAEVRPYVFGVLCHLGDGAVTGDVYVADILERLAKTDFATREGTLYPLLSRMRSEGLLDYDWRESAAKPPHKYYRLTDLGRTHLAEFRAYWTSLTSLIDELGR